VCQRVRSVARKEVDLATGSSLGFGVLAPLWLTINGTPVPLGTPKQRAVLAVLVINRNRTVSAESLIHAAWDDRPPPEARVSLQAYVSNLRKLLTRDGIDGRGVIGSVPPGYRLNVNEMSCDIGRFIIEKTAGVRAAADGDFELASSHLSAALAEWRGAPLEDLRDFQFAQTFGVAMIDDKVLVHTARAEAEMACGRAYTVIGELELLVAEHPYREPVWAQLINAYYVSNRQSDALQAYERLRRRLADDLGIDPTPALRKLQQKVLRQEPLHLKRSAQETAALTMTGIDLRNPERGQSAAARLLSSSGRVYTLQLATTRIGRLPDNDIVLPDPSVSRHHAVLIETGTNFVIVDLRSANGVCVQGERISVPTTLNDGDRIRLGNQELTFQCIR
jgi:SARP family transcriptional regulator, regulator of embCAB operon